MKISVFAASSNSIDQIYIDAAIDLGQLISENGYEVVYGGGDLGLMGALANSVQQSGGKITGVIPEFMVENGWNHTGVENMIITEDMSSRKKKIFSISDAVIALPGGVGTLEELTEAITLKQLGLFYGPVVILNTDGFYNKLIDFLDYLSVKSFIKADHKNIWKIASTPSEALEIINSYDGWNDKWVKLARI
jgi:hypothetical protein